MSAAHRRHDISDRVWERLQPLLPGGRPRWAGIRQPPLSQCRVLGSAHRRLPAGFAPGLWGLEEHRRRWRDRGVWARLPDAMIDGPDFERLMSVGYGLQL